MGNFCKGVLIGMLAGTVVGAVVVVKNKKLSNKLKEGLVTAEGKIKEVKENIEEKLNESSCGCGGNENSPACDCSEQNQEGQGEDNLKNNFSKKNKND